MLMVMIAMIYNTILNIESVCAQKFFDLGFVLHSFESAYMFNK